MTKYSFQKKYDLLLSTRKVILLISVLLVYNLCGAQKLHISGHVEGKLQTKITILLYPYFSIYWLNNNALKYEETNENNTFSFNTELETSHSYISIHLKNAEDHWGPISTFLVSAGDSIHILIKKNTILFSGRGREKYICQNQIKTVPEINFSTEELIAFNNNTSSYAFNMYSKKKMDSLLREKLLILKQYENKIPSSSYKQLALNYITENLFRQYLSLDFQYNPTEDTNIRNDKIKFFSELQKERLPPYANDSLIAASSYAIEFLLCKTKRELQFEDYINGKSPLEKHSPFKVAESASSEFGSLTKERLLAISFHLYYRPIEKKDTAELAQAIKEVKSDYFRRYLYSLRVAMNPGTEAQDFMLLNRNDEMIGLSEFKGKVIVLDFWFTGCGFCITLEKRMKVIREFFKNDSNVAFVSICFDKTKETFVKGVVSGKYTDPNGINLYTGSIAFDHPIANYYNITGCPEQVIIDKNFKTFVAKPERPIDEKTDRNFISLILKAKSQQASK